MHQDYTTFKTKQKKKRPNQNWFWPIIYNIKDSYVVFWIYGLKIGTYMNLKLDAFMDRDLKKQVINMVLMGESNRIPIHASQWVRACMSFRLLKTKLDSVWLISWLWHIQLVCILISVTNEHQDLPINLIKKYALHRFIDHEFSCRSLGLWYHDASWNQVKCMSVVSLHVNVSFFCLEKVELSIAISVH